MLVLFALPAYGQTIADIACDSGNAAKFSTLCAAVAASPTVLTALSDASAEYTVFAPNNDAFDALATKLGLSAATDLLPLPELPVLLLKHTLGSKVLAATALTLDNSVQPTLHTDDEEKIVVDGSTGDVLVTPTAIGGKAKVVTADITADNGVIHEIDKVIATRSLLSDTIAGKACDPALAATVGTLCAAVRSSTTVEVALSDVTGSFTVFAPNNAAFDALATKLDLSQATDLLPLPQLPDILLKHALGSKVSAATALALVNSVQATLQGDNIIVDGSSASTASASGITITRTFLGPAANVTTTNNIEVDNGFIHVIDAVLAPLEENVEWAGTFDVTNPATGEAFETLTWSAQSNEEGEYPDATMLISVQTGKADFNFDDALVAAGNEALAVGTACPDLMPNGEIKFDTAAPKPAGSPFPCYKLKFPCEMETEDGHEHCHATAHTAVWTIPIPAGVKSIAIFAQHYPTEFERSLHYLKGPGGEDIEPVNEMPEPEEREKRWGAAIGAAFIVMVCTLIGVIFLAPLFAKLQKEREALVNVLASAFAAGALLAAAFYLMLYEATHLIAITDDRTEAQASAWWGSATLLGFVSPFILEAIVSAVIGKAAPGQEVRKEADAEAAKPAAVVPAPNSRNKVRVLSGVLLGDFLHNLVDGFFIGAAFANCDSSMAWTITAATVYHELAQEISDYLVLTNPEQGGLKPFMALGLNFLSGMSVLFGVCIVLSAEPSNFSTGCLLAYGAGVYLQLAATECMPRVHEYATTLNMRLGGLLLFIIGATAIGLVLLDHEHCAGEGGHEGHGH